MSAGKHTPGPWIARKVAGPGWPGQRGWCIDYNEDQEQVTDFVYEEADAMLIAAAPELLHALEMMILFNRPMKGNAVALHNAYEAIAKATGSAK